MSAFSVYPGGSRAPLRTSESSQPRQSQPRQDDMNHLPTPHDGLPKNYLPPFHRSSSPSVTREGKENGYSNQRGDSRQNQPPIDTLRNQKSGNISDMARNEEERRNQAAWSPHRGRRDERSKGSTSASTLNGNGQSAPSSTNVDDVNRDFERLLDKFQVSATVRSRLTPLDTPLKRSLLCSPLALNSLIGNDISTNGSPARPTFGNLRAQSTLPSEAIPSSPQNRRTKSSQATVQDVPQIRKMQSGASLRGVDGGSPRSAHTGTHGRKTEYVDNAKFVVLNGSPVRPAAASRQAGGTALPGNGKRTSYLHTQDGIPVPPPLPYPDATSPDLRDNEYDFMHDLSRTSTGGDPFLGLHRNDYTNTVGSSSSNSSSGSRPLDGKLQTTRQKRSSVFSTKTKASKKNGDDTADESTMHSTIATAKTSKEKKRKSYTFGHSFSKTKAPVASNDHVPLLPHAFAKETFGTRKKEAGDLPLALAGFLRDAKTFDMDVDKVKRLRLLLGSESTSWIEAFIAAGGYRYLLARLQDLFDVEWRSEQHDDQLFFEILRCIKGLSTSEPGKEAIASHGVTPFRELVDLLYSEKKPGEVPPKQLILDLVFSLFDLYRQSGTAVPSLSQHRSPHVPVDTRGTPERPKSALSPPHPSSPKSTQQGIMAGVVGPSIPNGYGHISEFILSLLREPPTVNKAMDQEGYDDMSNRKSRIIAPASELPAPKLEMHEFLAVAHKPRIFQTYLKELSQTCWDFFWIMHYSKNGIWNFGDVDTESIKPKAPNGASGGVEYEAMRYLTSHFKLINTLARTLLEQDMADEAVRQDMKKGQACQFHADMMFSGMDRILCTVRKASTDLYPEFHLELARYLKLATDAEFDLPYVIKSLVTPPPDQYRRIGLGSSASQSQSQPSRHHQSRPHAMYVQSGPLNAYQAQGAAHATSWLPTPTDIGEFDFQL